MKTKKSFLLEVDKFALNLYARFSALIRSLGNTILKLDVKTMEVARWVETFSFSQVSIIAYTEGVHQK